MEKILVKLTDKYALWQISEIISCKVGENFSTSYPKDETLDFIRISDDAIAIQYYSKQPVLNR